MPEERITLKFRERGRIVWNREVVYQDYDLMGSRAYILAGNENGWLGYLEGKYFTPDFYIMVTSFDLISVNLLIRYGAEAQLKWACSGAPNYICSQSSAGIYSTEAECKLVCKGAPCSPVWKCETPANGYESDGCGLRRANTRCDPLVSGPLSLSSDKTTIKVGDLITFSGQYKSFAKVIIYEDTILSPKITEATCNSAGYYKVVAYLNKPVGTYRIRAKSDALLFPELSNVVTITVTAAAPAPCVPKWVCELPLSGYETDGCGYRRANSRCNPSTHFISLSLGFVPPELVSYFNTYILDISDQLMTKIAPPPYPWQYQGTTYDAVKNSFNLWFYLPPTATLTMSPGALDDLWEWISVWGLLILGAVLAIIGGVILASAFIAPVTGIALVAAIGSLIAGVAILSWRVYDAVTAEVKAETIATNLDNQISQTNTEMQAKQSVEAIWEKSAKTSDDCLTRLTALQSSHNARIKASLDQYAKYPDFITKLTAESTTFTANSNAIISGFRTQAYTADVCNTYVVKMDNEINSSNLRINDLLSTFVPPDVPYSVPCKGWTNQAGCEQAECFWYDGACHKEENCWIPNPIGGCILSAGTGKIIVGTVALIGIIGIGYWVATRHPGEAGAIITGAREAAREEAARARAAYEKFRVPGIPGTIPAVRKVPG